MSAPIWRFSVAAGGAGPDAVSGVMMPSVDRVGRAFPLTLARVQNGALDETTQGTVEDIALSALEDGMTKDRLSLALAALDATVTPTTPTTPTLTSGTQWQAVLQDRSLEFATPALPLGQDALRLFDLASWNCPSDDLQQARV